MPKSEPLVNEYNHFLRGIEEDVFFTKEVLSAIEVVKVVEQFSVSDRLRAEVVVE